MPTELTIEDLSVQYRDSSFYALQNINLRFSSPALVVVTGASGSGKSTLAQTIMGIIPSFIPASISGHIKINNTNINLLDRKQLIGSLGYVPQYPADFKVNLVVEEEIAFILENLRFPPHLIKDRVAELLEQLNITHLRHRLITELSSGELQRVALAIAFAPKPPILILDEPMARIDPKTEIELATILKDLAREGTLVIVFEHHLDYLLAKADHIVVLKEGKIIDEGASKEIVHSLQEIDLPEVSMIKTLKHKHFFTIHEAVNGIKEILYSYNKNSSASHFDFSIEHPILTNKSQESFSDSFIQAIKLSYFYKKSSKEVLSEISFNLPKGKAIGIIGPNGAGKTTLLRIIAGLLKAKHGIVLIDGKHIRSLRSTLGKVAFLPENAKLFLVGPTAEQDLAKLIKESNVAEIFEKYGLSSISSKKLYELSEGQRRLIAFFNAFHTKHEIILFDEPTIGLDVKGRRLFNTLLTKAKEAGKTVIISTNDSRILGYLDELLVLYDKKIQLYGKPREVLYELSKYEEIAPNQIVMLIEALKKELQTNIPHFITVEELNAWLSKIEVF
ncbi:MAG: ABC transporter ATP-binding protein [Candidatus Heimdallarchaeaceae archaeon]